VPAGGEGSVIRTVLLCLRRTPLLLCPVWPSVPLVHFLRCERSAAKKKKALKPGKFVRSYSAVEVDTALVDPNLWESVRYTGARIDHLFCRWLTLLVVGLD
jgi:hypothetical protein